VAEEAVATVNQDFQEDPLVVEAEMVVEVALDILVKVIVVEVVVAEEAEQQEMLLGGL
jgi:hypothetical protein